MQTRGKELLERTPFLVLLAVLLGVSVLVVGGFVARRRLRRRGGLRSPARTSFQSFTDEGNAPLPFPLPSLHRVGPAAGSNTRTNNLSVGQIVESPLHAATMELSSIAPAQLNGQGGEVPPTIAEERI